MNTEMQQQYQELCRGTATYILLRGNNNLGMSAEDIATLCAVDPATVREDIDKIVQTERRKVGGAFETKESPPIEMRAAH